MATYLTKICEQCGNEFKYALRGRVANERKFCSLGCYGLSKRGKDTWNKGKKMSNEYKEKLSRVDRPNVVNNLGCYAEKGIVPWNKGTGNGDLGSQIRTLKKYQDWRKSVINRDGCKCVSCGGNGKRDLVAHHKEALSKMIRQYSLKSIIDAENCSEIWNEDNGTTLCNGCHKKTDNYSGRAKGGDI